jgi:hypothetical protein
MVPVIDAIAAASKARDQETWERFRESGGLIGTA